MLSLDWRIYESLWLQVVKTLSPKYKDINTIMTTSMHVEINRCSISRVTISYIDTVPARARTGTIPVYKVLIYWYIPSFKKSLKKTEKQRKETAWKACMQCSLCNGRCQPCLEGAKWYLSCNELSGQYQTYTKHNRQCRSCTELTRQYWPYTIWYVPCITSSLPWFMYRLHD